MKKFTCLLMVTLLLFNLQFVKVTVASTKVNNDIENFFIKIDYNSSTVNPSFLDDCINLNSEVSHSNALSVYSLSGFDNNVQKQNNVNTLTNFSGVSANYLIPTVTIIPTELSLGSVQVGKTVTGIIQFHNNSGGDIEVNATSSNSFVKLNPTSFLSKSGAYVNIVISFEVVAEGLNSSNLIFNTNSEAYPSFNATVLAYGYYPSKITVDPSLFNIAVEYGSIVSKDFSIFNSGTGQLFYEVLFNQDITAPSSSKSKVVINDKRVNEKLYGQFTSANSSPELARTSKSANGIISSVYLPSVGLSTGMVWVDGYLYLIDYYSSSLYRYNPEDGVTTLISGIHSNPYGITWDGNYFWIGNSAGRFYSYEIDGSATGTSFQGPYSFYSSICYHNNEFFLSGLGLNQIFKVNSSGTVLWSKILPESLTGDQIIYIESHTTGNLWLQPSSGDKIYQLDNDLNKIVRSINNGSYSSCYSLSYDGRYFYSSFNSNLNVIDPSYLYTYTDFGNIDKNSSEKVTFYLDATKLSVGSHYGEIVINSNDIDNPSVIIPVNINVTGQPKILVLTNLVDYDKKLVGTINERYINIINEGGVALEISNFTTSFPELSYSISSTRVLPGENAVLTLRFSPSNIQEYSGVISFKTNDPNNPNLAIAVKGVGSKSIVKFNVKDASTGLEINNATITFNGITNEPGNYTFINVNGGSLPYTINASGYLTQTGSVNVNEFEIFVNAPLNVVGSEIVMANGSVITNCHNTFFDSGFTGNYSNNINQTITLLPPDPSSKVKVEFQSFQLESGWDYLYIYNGLNTSAPLLGTYSGSNLPPTFTATNPDGALTFRFYTDGSVVYPGWVASVTCVQGASIEPLKFDVIDEFTSLPLANAIISIDGIGTGTTNISGNYSFGLIDGGSYSYSVVKDGYFEKVGAFIYPSETNISVELLEWPSITFIVKDPSGNPVVGADVSFGVYSAITDVSGVAVINQVAPFNNYLWTVSANGFQPISGEQFFGNESVVVNANFVVSLPTIRFNVTDEFSAPFANAQVNLDGNTILTDGSGQATFQLNEPFLNHTWSVSASGYKTLSGELYAGTEPVTLNLQLVPDLVNLTVVVRDINTGHSLADAVVVVNGDRYVTGVDGKLFFNGVPKGNYSVQVIRHAYVSFNQTVMVDKEQIDFNLAKIQAVSLPYSESFNSGIPSNYSVYDLQTVNYDPIWSNYDGNNAGGVSQELNANWRNGVSTVRLLLPPINTLGLNTIYLSFRQFFDDWGAGMKVLVETSSNGSEWTPTGWEINSGSGNYGPEQINMPISSNTNSTSTYIAFTLTGNLYQLDDWYVDDIQVTQPGVALYNASFTVSNNSTSEALSGAEIALNGYGSLLTNNAGIAYFTNIPNGTYSYTVSKSGFNVYSGSITINNGNSSAFVGLVPLSYYSLTINVFKQGTSTPIPGALVTVSGANAAETNSQGKVVWTNLPSGTYSYTITKEGYNNYSGSASVTYNRTLNRYLSQKYFEANFTVVDANSNPVQNALISVAGKTAVVTNEFGQATIGNLENANYNFTIQKTGYSLYSSSFNISGANSNVNATLALAPAPQYSILFKVTKLDATPISNATVWLTGFGPVTTNVNGEVLFSNIASGSSLTYEVQQTNYLNSTGSVGPMNENKQLVVVLKPVVVEKYQVTFNVKDASGTSLAGALVDLGSYGTGSTNGAGNVVFSNVDFTEQLPYQVSLAGYKTVQGNATVHSNTNVPVILPLLATTTYSVTFSITNSIGGYVKGANVSLSGYGTLMTDNSGSAVFTQVNPQNGINYTVSMPPYSSLSGSVNVVNTNIVQNLILSTNVYRALFKVVDQFGNPLEGVNVDVLGGGRAVTNVYGNAIVGGLSTGTYSYNVYMPNGTPMNGGFNITNSDLPIQVTLPRSTQTVTFTVKDEFGGVIQNANVELLGYGSKITDADGKVYYVNVLSANNKTYTVSKSGYENFIGVITIENSSLQQNVILRIVRHSVQFSVSAGSKSIPDATVTFNGVTNATGNYLFSNVIPGNGYAYSVSRMGYVTKSGIANVTGYTEIPINLEVEEFMVTFNVSLPTTKVGQKSNPAKILIGGTADTLIVSENGSTNVSLPKGYYNFKVWADGCQPHYGSFEIVNTAINISVTLKIPTGVDDNYLLSIKAYPNPFQSQINLDNCSEIKQIIVHNLIGQPVIDEKYSNNNRITMNTADLLPGVYFIKLIGNDGATRAIRMIKN